VVRRRLATPQLTFIAPSRTKREFFARLDLLEGCEDDGRIYRMMQVGAGK